jgi:hypothetical protein
MKKVTKIRARRAQAGAPDLSKMRKLVKLTLLFTLLAIGSTVVLAIWAIYQGTAGARTESTALLPLKNALGLLPFLCAIPGVILSILAMRQEGGGEKGNKLWTVSFALLAVCLSYLMFFPVGYLHFRLWSSVGPVTVFEQIASPKGDSRLVVLDVPRFKGPVRELWLENDAQSEKRYLVDVANRTPMPQEITWGEGDKTVVIQYHGRKKFEVDLVTGKELNGKTLPYDPDAEALEQFRKKVHDEQPEECKAPAGNQPATPPAPEQPAQPTTPAEPASEAPPSPD